MFKRKTKKGNAVFVVRFPMETGLKEVQTCLVFMLSGNMFQIQVKSHAPKKIKSIHSPKGKISKRAIMGVK